MRAVASARLSTPGGRISSIRLVQSAPGGAVCGGVYVRIWADTRDAPMATNSVSTATPEQASIAITANFLTLTAHLPVRKTRDSAEGEKVAHSAAVFNPVHPRCERRRRRAVTAESSKGAFRLPLSRVPIGARYVNLHDGRCRTLVVNNELVAQSNAFKERLR